MHYSFPCAEEEERSCERKQVPSPHDVSSRERGGSDSRLRQRQLDSHLRATPHHRLNIQGSAVHFDQAAGQG